MKLPLVLPADVSIALRRFVEEHSVSFEEAAIMLLRDSLTGLGLLEAEDDGEE